jgi:hypothetical protein
MDSFESLVGALLCGGSFGFKFGVNFAFFGL